MNSKTNPRYTPEGLPVLTTDTVEMHFIEEKRLDRENDESLMAVMETRAKEVFGKNPVLETALERFCKEYGFEGEEELLVQAAGAYVYQLMKRQAEVNGLGKIVEKLE